MNNYITSDKRLLHLMQDTGAFREFEASACHYLIPSHLTDSTAIKRFSLFTLNVQFELNS